MSAKSRLCSGAVPARLKLKSSPSCYLAKGQTWPDGRLKGKPPPEAVLAQQVSRIFKRAVDAAGHSHRQAAEKAKIAPSTVQGLLSGQSWATLPTLASIERAYNIKLWVNQHGSLQPHPCSYLAEGQTWPDGRLKSSAPPEAVLAQEIARRFRNRCKSRFEDHDEPRGFDPDRVVAAAKIPRTTVEDLLDGRIWCDLPTIARIEGSLDIALWVNQQSRRDRYR